ncbi:MAG: VWA domain-containing protein [Bdellovibrionales bacterium]|nr:VWA domain-containing protein [Bdellovibrionales bacterium]MCB0419126.1 VWA domain-containing protein [Bdellovibrionales bacterium]MCB9253934.1 VWA domain-containing protein [Pseudobdellovibrionaceae bacterium]
MKITAKNGCDFRPKDGDYSTTTLIELTPDAKLGRVPSNVVFLVDASSSMSGSKWKTAKTAMREIVDSLKDDDRVAIVLFHSSAKEVFPLASLAANRDAMKEAISKLEDPQGVTNLEAGLKSAYGAFDARSAADKVKRVNHVILLTDGFPTDNQGYRVEKTAKYEDIVKTHEGITLTGIGIGSAEEYDSGFIGRISDLGRGSYYHANDLSKFKAGLQAEIEKLQSSVVGELTLNFRNLKGRLMRIAKVTPEIVLYDSPGNPGTYNLATGSMTKDTTSFLIQTNTYGDGVSGSNLVLFEIFATYDGKETEHVKVEIKTSDKETDLTAADPDVMRSSQMLQVHLNGEQIKKSLDSGDREKATRLIQNTTRIASNLGANNVTRALTRMAKDVQKGKSVSDDLATIQDESKKTRLLIG